jgi:hypothetical protein
MTDSIVQALLAEREGYVRRGLKDRVAQVDAQLARFGIAVDRRVETAAVEVDSEKAVSKQVARKRKA